MLERSWAALPDECRHRRALDLLNAPIAGMDSEPPLEYVWADPVELFVNDGTSLRRTSGNEHQWKSAVDLVTRALAGNATVRRRASIRMIPLVDSGLLTDGESQEIANALWSEQHTPPDGLPANVATPDWALLTLPEAMPALAQKHFIAKWITADDKTGWQHKGSIEIFGNSTNGLNHDPQDVDSSLWPVGAAMVSLRSRGQRLELLDPEKSNLQKMIEIWTDAVIPDIAAPDHPLFLLQVGSLHKARTQEVPQVLPAIVGEIGLSQEAGEKLYAKMQDLNQNKCQRSS